MRNLTVTPRASEMATAAHLGAWDCAIRLNSRRRKKVLFNVGPMLIVGIGGIVWTLLSNTPGFMLVVFGLITLVGIALLIPTFHLLRLGELLLHRFEHGFVIERERGGALSATYERAAAQIIEFNEPGDSTSTPLPHVAVRFTFAEDEVVMVEEPQSGSPDALMAVAERCGTVERSTLSYVESQRLRLGATLNL